MIKHTCHFYNEVNSNLCPRVLSGDERVAEEISDGLSMYPSSSPARAPAKWGRKHTSPSQYAEEQAWLQTEASLQVCHASRLEPTRPLQSVVARTRLNGN